MEYRIEQDGIKKKNSYGIHSPVYGGLMMGMPKIMTDNKSKSKNKSKKKSVDVNVIVIREKRLIDFTKTIPEIHVYTGFLNINKNNAEECIIKLSCINSKNAIKVLAVYNKRNDRYYVAYDQIKHNIKERHIFKAKMVADSNSFSDFREFSELKLYGYAVGNSGEDVITRHKIIKHVLDNRVMSGYQIISHLQGQIALRKSRSDKNYSKAIADWENDIKYVQQYVIKLKSISRVNAA